MVSEGLAEQVIGDTDLEEGAGKARGQLGDSGAGRRQGTGPGRGDKVSERSHQERCALSPCGLGGPGQSHTAPPGDPH